MACIRRICHRLVGLARRAGALAASAAAVPTVAATVPPGWNHHPPMPLEYIFGPVVKVPGRTVVVGGMPGWHIALIAAVAAVLAAVLAVLADRAWAERRHQMADPGLSHDRGTTTPAAAHPPRPARGRRPDPMPVAPNWTI